MWDNTSTWRPPRARATSFLLLAAWMLSTASACVSRAGAGGDHLEPPPIPEHGPVTLPEATWRAHLSPEQFAVLREGKTEKAFSGAYWNHSAEGVYHCAACNQLLYRSQDKFDAGTGRPSFTRPAEPAAIEAIGEKAFGTVRIDLKCSRCGGHLGFAYDDGPAPTGLRHSLNSIALVFEATPTSRSRSPASRL